MTPKMLSGLRNPSWRSLQDQRRQPDNPDKGSSWLTFLAFCALVSVICWAAFGCATSRTTLPDGTVIEQSKPHIEKDTKYFIGDVIRAYSPRPLPPRPVEAAK